MIDVVTLCQELIRFSSVTPQSAGCLEHIGALLKTFNFDVQFLEFGTGDQQVKNLYARYGQQGPHLNFLGHIDVVPPGPLESWAHSPFAGTIEDGKLYGRGAVDMKGAVACFIAAVVAVLPSVTGSVSLLLTADEEGPAINGTKKVVEWLQQHNAAPDFCLVGEPTNPTLTDKIIKIGRRGSLNIDIESKGVQGHVAYPEKALNPVHPLIQFLGKLIEQPLDAGTAEFDPSGLQITTIDCQNVATNIIPQAITAKCNIRFNPVHSGRFLTEWLQTLASPYGVDINVKSCSEPFVTKPGFVHSLLQQSIEKITGRVAQFSTTGGTSDARFMQVLCPTMEFGLMNETMHKVNEHVLIEDLQSLKNIYQDFIAQFFKQNIDRH